MAKSPERVRIVGDFAAGRNESFCFSGPCLCLRGGQALEGVTDRAVGGWLSRTCSWLGGCVQTGWGWASGACGRVAAGVAAVCAALPALLMVLWAYRRPVLLAVAVGLVIGLGSYWAGPFIASFVSGLLAFVGALVVSLLRRLRAVMEAVRVPGGWAN
jgi:hypothetical protein